MNYRFALIFLILVFQLHGKMNSQGNNQLQKTLIDKSEIQLINRLKSKSGRNYICKNQVDTLFVSDNSLNDVKSIFWYRNKTLIDSAKTYLTISKGGLYQVHYILKSPDGKLTKFTEKLTIKEPIVPFVMVSDSFISQSSKVSVMALPYSHNYTFLWGDQTENQNYYLLDSSGKYYFNFIDSNGCKIRDSIEIFRKGVFISQSLSKYAPNPKYEQSFNDTIKLCNYSKESPKNVQVQVEIPDGYIATNSPIGWDRSNQTFTLNNLTFAPANNQYNPSCKYFVFTLQANNACEASICATITKYPDLKTNQQLPSHCIKVNKDKKLNPKITSDIESPKCFDKKITYFGSYNSINSVDSVYTKWFVNGIEQFIKKDTFSTYQTGKINFEVSQSGCKQSTLITMNNHPEITYSTTKVRPCIQPNSSRGSIKINDISPTNATFNWSDNTKSNLKTSLTPGIYYLTITDSFGCKKRDSINLGYADSNLSLSIQYISPAICLPNIKKGSIQYNYSPLNAAFFINNKLQEFYNTMTTSLDAGFYQIKIAKDGCERKKDVILNNNNFPEFDAIFAKKNNGLEFKVNFTNSNLIGSKCQWFTVVNGVKIIIAISDISAINKFKTLIDGDLYVEIIDKNGCKFIKKAIFQP